MKIIGKCKKVLLAALITVGATSEADAASVSYLLDQSNIFPDGVNYLQVTIDDQGTPGDINFTVTPLSPLLMGDQPVIQKFALNGLGLSSANIVLTGMSSQGWRVLNNKKVSEFGTFSTVISGRRTHRADPLTFSITGINNDSINSYTALSTGGNSVFFSAKSKAPGLRRDYAASGYFGGGTSLVTPTSVVPLPPAITLFGSGLIGLIGIAGRNREKYIPGWRA